MREVWAGLPETFTCKHFKSINPHSNPKRKILLLSSFYYKKVEVQKHGFLAQVHALKNKRTCVQPYQLVLMQTARVSQLQATKISPHLPKQEERTKGLWCSSRRKGKVRHMIGKDRKQSSFKGLGGRNEGTIISSE